MTKRFASGTQDHWEHTGTHWKQNGEATENTQPLRTRTMPADELEKGRNVREGEKHLCTRGASEVIRSRLKSPNRRIVNHTKRCASIGLHTMKSIATEDYSLP